MSAILHPAPDWIAAALALAVLVYLIYTMLRPERF